MGMKRSANTGDFNRARERLKELGGTVEGNSKTIQKKLGFDGGWKELVEGLGVPFIKTDIGRYAVSLGDHTTTDELQSIQEELTPVDPDIYASCAANFLIGEGDMEEFEDYTGRYDKINVIKAALATHIEYSLGGLHLPPNTNEDIEVYTMKRSLMYTAPGDDTFRMYGASILERV